MSNPNDYRLHRPGRPTDEQILRSVIVTFVVGKNAATKTSEHAWFTANAWLSACLNGLLTPENLGQPTTTSEISGTPAYEILLSDGFDRRQPRVLCLRLNLNEMSRMGRLKLKPEEFKKLRDAHGIFFEIHDDFYDPKTGVAIQPR